MTELMKDILKQPEVLSRSMLNLLGSGGSLLEKAARVIKEAEHVYITGIGSSWHAGMAVLSLFHANGRSIDLVEASEFLNFTRIARDSAVIVISRSGKSIEIVNLLSQARQAGARIIAITNTAESPLAQAAEITLNPQAPFDHFVSVNMYSALALVGGLLAATALDVCDEALTTSLEKSLEATQSQLDLWVRQIQLSSWFERDAVTYFLARGGSVASCHGARLLWEEAAKAPATAMTTGGFRHGPQEIIVNGSCFGLWLDSERMRDQDLAVAVDIRKLGGKVMLVGQNVPADAADLVLSLPEISGPWQFLIDIIPAQLAAERLSHMRGVDCDSFRICSYIVEDEYGLIREPMPKG
jgi:glucosamine--fructose-6-phosphate aminotransferase (isomerizing)